MHTPDQEFDREIILVQHLTKQWTGNNVSYGVSNFFAEIPIRKEHVVHLAPDLSPKGFRLLHQWTCDQIKMTANWISRGEYVTARLQ